MKNDRDKKLTLKCGKCRCVMGSMKRIVGGWTWKCKDCGWVGVIKF